MLAYFWGTDPQREFTEAQGRRQSNLMANLLSQQPSLEDSCGPGA